MRNIQMAKKKVVAETRQVCIRSKKLAYMYTHTNRHVLYTRALSLSLPDGREVRGWEARSLLNTGRQERWPAVASALSSLLEVKIDLVLENSSNKRQDRHLSQRSQLNLIGLVIARRKVCSSCVLQLRLFMYTCLIAKSYKGTVSLAL